MSHKKNKLITVLTVLPLIAGIGCGGSDSDPDNPPAATPSTVLSGTAAAGAALIGTVTVKGALGNTKSSYIEADGNYTVDVTGLTAPYRLRAQGTVGGRTYKLHSYAVEDDLGGTVNITPFTDLIVANTAAQIAESYFDSNAPADLDPAELDAQEDELQAKLQNVFDALGLDTAIDLLNSSFSADHSGLDAALDIVRVEVDDTTNIATITNLVDNTTIEDTVTVTGETDTLVVSDPTNIQNAVSDTQQIVNILDGLTAAFASGLPTSNAITDYFADDFYESDENKAAFLTDITTDPGLIGINFGNVSVDNLDATAGTAEVVFNISFNGVTDLEPVRWLVAKNTADTWQLRGDQRIVETSFGYHCNDNDAVDSFPGDCGINTQFWDEDFTNNGTTNDAPIASGTVKIIDPDTQALKATVYLGTPVNGTAGDVQVYNEATGEFQWDWKAFGTGVGEIDPAVFVPGDIIEYALYEADLDTSTQASPQVVGTPVATYTDRILFAPDQDLGKLPSATSATVSAISSYTLGDDLTVEWTLAADTQIDEVAVIISDSQGNRVEVWDWLIGSTDSSVTISSTQLDTSAAGLSSTDSSYQLQVRVYARDNSTTQYYSRFYHATISTGGSAGSGDCDTSAVTTRDEFITVMTACSTRVAFDAADLIGNSFTYVAYPNEVSSYNADGTGSFTNDGGTTTFTFDWVVDSNGFLDITYAAGFNDLYAIYGIDGATGGYLVTAFTSEAGGSVFNETVIPADGSAGLSCNYETPLDDLNDQPSAFDSYDDFEAVVASCTNVATGLTVNGFAGTYVANWTDVGVTAGVDTLIFNNDGSGSYTSVADSVQVDSIDFDWTIVNDRVVITVTSLYMEVWAVLNDGSFKIYAEDATWTPASDLSITDTTTLDGEIYTESSFVKQ